MKSGKFDTEKTSAAGGGAGGCLQKPPAKRALRYFSKEVLEKPFSKITGVFIPNYIILGYFTSTITLTTIKFVKTNKLLTKQNLHLIFLNLCSII
ncbi:MAG: hypothetical protein IJB70_01005 [Clostridia bacterium]|nr:hypothetical protein [Clostridia bacterium]